MSTKREIVFRLDEPEIASEKQKIIKKDINALLLSDDDLCFTSFILDYDLLCLDPKNLNVLGDDLYIIKYRPVSDIDSPIYFRESKTSPGVYEEKWRELNSEELETIKYFIKDMREATFNSHFIISDVTCDDIISYYNSHKREIKLKDLGI